MAQFSLCLLSNRSHCSPLKTAHPARFPHRVPVAPNLSLTSSSGWCSQKFREWSILLHLWLLLCVPSLLLLQKGLTPPQCPVTHFSQSNGSPVYIVCDHQFYGLPKDPAECCPASQTRLLSPASSADALPVVVTFLRRSYCFGPWFLISLLHFVCD
jgi:hypothetical protein